MDNGEYRELQRQERHNKRKKKVRILRILLALGIILAVVLGFAIYDMYAQKAAEKEKEDAEKQAAETVVQNETQEDAEAKEKRAEQIEKAEYLAMTYDYDAAIAELELIQGYESDEEIQTLLTEIKDTKASCVPVNIDEVTHIYYHSLVVDPERAFANQEKDSQAAGNNQWMTTVSEFNKITQEMYDRGYVMVSIHDLINVTQDEKGNTVYEPAEILLPPDKKAFVLSMDDLNYYHAYDGYGFATKLVLDEDGKVMNEYTDADGKTTIGAYDVVPLMDQFVEEHPDASYRGAKGIIGLTGYNGILGYRTDSTYDLDNPDCDDHQKAWIKAHPDFTLESEIEEAQKVVNAMKENGWEFANHTWGHLEIQDTSMKKLKSDTEKWKKNVEPIVGETDAILFAHGQDIQGRGDYDKDNEKYQYLRSQGYSIFCNVDSEEYTTWFGTDYLRQGRRNLDGYRIYYNAIGEQDNLSDLFDAKEILDPKRPKVPEL